MQKVVGYIRHAVDRFGMIEDGDKIAVGVSGGKDSLATLMGLHKLSSFYKKRFEVSALVIDPGFGGTCTDFSPVEELCEKNGIPLVIKRSEIGEIVFDRRQETNPCSLCARMRRGLLHDSTKEMGCTKLALGHNYDDAIETFMMNLFNEGRIGCFQPVTYMSRKDLTVIRPLVLMPENEVRNAVVRAGFSVVKSQCPIDGHTGREAAKTYLKELEAADPGVKKRIFGALCRSGLDGWK